MTLFFVIAVCVGGAVGLLLWGLAGLQAEVQATDRSYQDEPPPLLKSVWPVISFFRHYFAARTPTAMLENAHKQIARAGLHHTINAEEFVAIKMVATIVAAIIFWFVCSGMSGATMLMMTFMGALLGFVYPDLWLKKRGDQRRDEILKTLPVFLDYLVLGVESGMNFMSAMGQCVEKGPAGHLRQEFALVQRDVRAGLSRIDALKRLDERLDVPEISAFVSAIVQAEQIGASTGKVLRLQAQRRRSERFQRAEKAAMEAPVKLILPLVLFIFPTTFIILAFPIAMMVRQQGLL